MLKMLSNGNDIYIASDRKGQKVLALLVKYVYMQTNVAMLASLFCASIVFLDLLKTAKMSVPLFTWAGIYLAVTASRSILCYVYSLDKFPENKINLWRNLYIIGSILGGTSWGLASILIMPYATSTQQTLMILMMAGVTAGAVLLSAAIPSAAITFLFFSLFPFIVLLSVSKNSTYFLFNLALSAYFLYSIALTLKAYKLIKSSIILQFENDLLLKDLEITNKQLEQAATHDPLTRVGNRRLFELNLANTIKSAEINRKIFALFYIDLDNFKIANDLYGHQAGDYILITVIERLAKYFRKNDIIARLGGDELAIIVQDTNNKDELKIIAKKICQLVAMPIETNNTILKVTASIGVSVYPYDGHDSDTLIRTADKYMYYAKQNGGNHFYFSNEIKEFTNI